MSKHPAHRYASTQPLHSQRVKLEELSPLDEVSLLGPFSVEGDEPFVPEGGECLLAYRGAVIFAS